MPKEKHERFIESTLTVGQLIEKLKNLDPALPVLTAYPAGDHWRNTLAGVVHRVTEEEVVWSDYHEQWKMPKDSRDDDHEKSTSAVVLD